MRLLEVEFVQLRGVVVEGGCFAVGLGGRRLGALLRTVDVVPSLFVCVDAACPSAQNTQDSAGREGGTRTGRNEMTALTGLPTHLPLSQNVIPPSCSSRS